jgi:hypothetical protein
MWYFPVKSVSALYNWLRSATLTIHATIVVKLCEKNNSFGSAYRICKGGIVKKAKRRWNKQKGASNELEEGCWTVT